MLTLAAFNRRIATGLDAGQRELVERRAAECVGHDLRDWATVRERPVDLVLLRDLHRMLYGDEARVRRAELDGRWAIANARGGHLRSQPQSFRAGTHVEPAWDHNALARRVNEVVVGAMAALAAEPVAAISSLVWSLARAQPFAGGNERIALVFASRLLADAALPVLHVAEIERDPAFARALSAPTTDPLAAYLARAVSAAALAFAEWLVIPAPPEARWTLADEHATLEAARARAQVIPPGELVALVEAAATVVGELLAPRFGPLVASSVATSTYAERLRVTIESGGRARHLCVQHPVHELRWRIDETSGLEAILVAGTAGRGISGAAAVHLALALPGVPARGTAPGLLIVPDEPAPGRIRRFTAWAPGALEQVLADCPLRI